MNPTAIAALPRFFLISGAVLVVTGLLKLWILPRREGASPLEHWLSRGSLWAVFCVAVGVAGVLVGLGVIPLRPGQFGPTPPSNVQLH